jgi:aspartyl-tRNA(Asn)/glutamyl-tRNA(Gln) amidotransferase subunit C
MTNISVNHVQKLAQLSALSLTEDEVVSLANELTNILGYVEQLSEIDTEGVEPTYQVTGLHTVTRKDEIIDYGVSQEELLKNAPDVQDAQMKVPRVLG